MTSVPIFYKPSDGSLSVPVFKIKRIEYPPEGGIISYIEGTNNEEIPWKGLPDPVIIYALGSIKRAFKNLVYFALKHKMYLLLGLAYRKKIYTEFCDFTVLALKYYSLLPQEWCVSVREFWRAGKVLNQTEMWRIFCLVLEYDNAYRLRTHLAFTLLNKELLLANPKKEMDKLLIEMQRREKSQAMRDKYDRIKPLTKLFYIPKVARKFKELMGEIDFELIKPDEMDKRWMKMAISVEMD